VLWCDAISNVTQNAAVDRKQLVNGKVLGHWMTEWTVLQGAT